jgi:hypothetical protein
MKFSVRPDADGLYVVQTAAPIRDPRWWTASRQSDGWYILSGRGMRIVQEDGKLGRGIVAAVEEFIANQRNT